MDAKHAGHNLQIICKGEGTEIFLDDFKLMCVIDYRVTMKPNDCELTVVLDISDSFGCKTAVDAIAVSQCSLRSE